jgi:hypothetical protein
MGFLTYLDRIDRRIMYLLLAVVVIVPLIFPIIRQKTEITPEVMKAYEAVEKLPTKDAPRKDYKIAVISVFFGPGTMAENRPQMEALVRHFFRRGVPFGILPFDQAGTTLAYNKVDQIAKEMNKEYGKDWIAFSWQPIFDQTLQAMATNVPRTLGRDKRYNAPLTDTKRFPIMEGIKTAGDFSMVVEVTPSGTVPAWISYIGQTKKVPIVYCPTGVMVPEGYNFLDAHQIVGMLPGLMGAARYEAALGEKGFATRAAGSLSTSHVLIIVLIILGNIGYFMSLRQRSSS